MSVLASSGGGGALDFLVIPLLTVLFSGIIASAATYPLWRDRAAKAQERADREARLDRTMDHVLGCEADTHTGKPAVVGLIHTVPALAKGVQDISNTIGQVTPGQTVMGSLNEATRKIENVGLGQATLSETVDTHMILDDSRFRELNREIGAQRHRHEMFERDVNKAVKGIRDTVDQIAEAR